jgi:hypothetical protein
MKLTNLFRLLFLALVVTFIAPSCVKEGPMGKTGENGANGAAGKDANAVCLTCHAKASMDGKQSEYTFSKHFFGNTVGRNTKYCGRCHTSDGFIEITSKPWASGALISAANDNPTAKRISCETCHTHTTFEFGADPAEDILRTTSPVSMNYYNNKKTEDFGKIENLCVTCHQIRGATTVAVALKSKLDNTKDSVTKAGALVSKSFAQLPFFPFDNTGKSAADMAKEVDFLVGQSVAVHDGNQSNLFAGINGFEYPGKTYTRTWKHSLVGGAIPFNCVSCHMNEVGQGMNKNYPNADGTSGKVTTVGGHTLVPNEEACKKCHTTDPLTTVPAAIEGKLKELGDLLVSKKLFKPSLDSKTGAVVPFNPANETGTPSAFNAQDFYGKLLPTTADGNKYGLALAAANSTTSGSLSVTYVSTVTMRKDETTFGANVLSDAIYRKGSKWTYGELGAAYNFGFINSELSKGIHNPTYAQQLLQTSIDYLNGK